MTNNKLNENAIREAAYYIWQNSGSPMGQDAKFWSMAIEQLSNSCSGSCNASSSKKSSSSTAKKASASTSSTAKKSSSSTSAAKKSSKK